MKHFNMYLAVAGSFADSVFYVASLFLGDARVLCRGVEHNKEPDDAPNQSHNSCDVEDGLPSYGRNQEPTHRHGDRCPQGRRCNKLHPWSATCPRVYTEWSELHTDKSNGHFT